MTQKVLIVDDDPDIALMLSDRIAALGYDTVRAGDGTEALELLQHEEIALVLLDLEMPKMSGMDVLEHLSQRQQLNDATLQTETNSGPRVSAPGLIPPIVVMTAHATVTRAVEAMKCGAYDFLLKPLNIDHLALAMGKAMERESLKQHVEYLRTEVESRYSVIVGRNPKITALTTMAKRAANSDATVLLLGESGTGKELFARSIHQWSPRRKHPFVIINCVALNDTLLENELFGHEKGAYTGASSIQKGKIEIADGGTLFLDEIGDMHQDLQVKLLRFLQDREFHRVGGTRQVHVNIRVIAATNRDLRQAVKTGRFREDLYFRLNVVTFSLPPLRERPDDIQSLAEMFLQRHIREMGKPKMALTPEAKSYMNTYAWPGNIRELDNAISRAVVLGIGPMIGTDQLGLTMLPDYKAPDPAGLSYHDALEWYSCHIIEQTLQRCHGNQTKAADELGLQRSYLARLIKQKNIHFIQ
ncbi:MAG: response regulator [Nitrospirales bacterium]|nr:response regulator [Nitrospirales bacterium]